MMASPTDPLIIPTDRGLYCPLGDFYIDPWRRVGRAVVTHAHADHLRWGSDAYLVSSEGEGVTRVRLGVGAHVETLPYGEATRIRDVRVSLHPAGHILGSAQVRVEYRGQVWVVTGDYKTDGADGTCTPLEVVRCDAIISESTFGLPVFRWEPAATVFDQINTWWGENQTAGKVSVVFAYSLGKAQRVLAGVDPSIGAIYLHGAVANMTEVYRAGGVDLPPATYARVRESRDWRGALLIAPPSANGTPWLRKFGALSTAFASGWMRIRGARRRRALDRGFILSDHADWGGLVMAIRASGAQQVFLTHGYTAVMVRWLREQGIAAAAISTRFEGEVDDPSFVEEPTPTPDAEP